MWTVESFKEILKLVNKAISQPSAYSLPELCCLYHNVTCGQFVCFHGRWPQRVFDHLLAALSVGHFLRSDYKSKTTVTSSLFLFLSLFIKKQKGHQLCLDSYRLVKGKNADRWVVRGSTHCNYEYFLQDCS